MNSLVRDLVVALVLDVRPKAGATDTGRDIKCIMSRTENEGDSFLTITLPNFCKDFERSLDEGWIDPRAFNGFRKSARSPCVPAFLQEHMLNVFGLDGRILDEPKISSIIAIRQICLFAKKVERDCTEQRKLSAVDAFIQTEEEVRDNAESVKDSTLWDTYGRVCDVVMSHILDDSFYEEIVPRHGSGATANRVRGNSKWEFPTWPTKLEESFPFSEFGLCSLNNYEGFVHEEPPSRDELPARLALVPKTLKTPRIIAIEPSWNQFIQQGLMRWIVPRIEMGKFTAGRVNFRHQGVNMKLAEKSSIDRTLSTLDLSEASDRVSLVLVERLLRIHPFFYECVLACRSDKIELPNGEVMPLKKFASMGSALCFPMEALVFFCTIVSSRIHSRGLRPSSRCVYEMSRNVYVYGDDLIVPTDEVACVVAGLQTMGLKVNTTKSFSKGFFRESCGGDFYKGKSVRPVYYRRDLRNDKLSAHSIISNVSTANQLFDAGLYRTSAILKEKIEESFGRKLPQVPRNSSALGWYGFSTHTPRIRYNRRTQTREYLAYVPKVRRMRDHLEGDGALAKCLRLIGEETDERHLEYSVSPRELAISRKWIPLGN